MHIPSELRPKALEDVLWQTALEAAGPLEIDPACALFPHYIGQRYIQLIEDSLMSHFINRGSTS